MGKKSALFGGALVVASVLALVLAWLPGASSPSGATGMAASAVGESLHRTENADKPAVSVLPVAVPDALPERSLPLSAAPDALAEHTGVTGISGEVRNLQGEPIAGVRIEAAKGAGQGDLPPLETSSDAAGRFQLAPLAPGISYRLLARHPEYAPREITNVVPAPETGQTTLPVMILFPAGRLVGWVVDPAGVPLPGATLEAYVLDGEPLAPGHTALQSTSSDEAGAFSLEGLPHESLTVVASLPGRASSRLEGVAVSSKQNKALEFVLEPAASLEGLVTDAEGLPVPDGIVEAFRQETGAFARRVATGCDENGRFLLESLAAGAYNVRVRAPGFQTLSVGPVQTSGDPLALALELAQRIEGVVLTPDGQAIPDAQITLLRPSLDALGAEVVPGFQVTSDAHGAFSLPTPYHGAYWAEARAKGWSAGRSEIVVLEREEAVVEADVLVTQGATVVARIVDAQQQPVSGAQVSALRDEGAPAGATESSRIESQAASGPDGVVRLPGVPPGDMRIIVRAPGLAPGVAQAFGLWAGDARDLGDIVLETGGAVAGRVAAMDGSPIAGGEVQLLRTDSDELPMRRVQALTDPEGRFRIGGLPAGRWFVTAQQSTGEGRSMPGLVDAARGQELVVSLSAGQLLDGVALTLMPRP